MAIKYPVLSILFLLISVNINAQEILALNSMQVEEYETTDILPLTDADGNIHMFAISENPMIDENILHLKCDLATGEITNKSYPKPKNKDSKEAVGISLDSQNTVHIYLHSKGKGIFHVISIGKDGDYKHREIELKTKKEKVVKYISYDNEFFMLTVNRRESVINIYEFEGDNYSKNSFDLNSERFYSKESKIVPLANLFADLYSSTISNELNSEALDFGSRIKIYPLKDKITISLNSNDNGTRIIHLNRQSKTATTDYIPMPTSEFAQGPETSIKTNSFIHKDNIYSLIVSNKLLVIDIKRMSDKEVLKVFKFDPDQKVSLELSKSTTIPIGPISIENDKTKQKTKSAKSFFRKLKGAMYYGLFVEQKGSEILVKIGGFTPPSASSGPVMGFQPGSVNANMDANGNVSIASSAPTPAFQGTGFSSFVYGFEKYMLIDAENYELLGEAIYEDIYDKVETLGNEKKDTELETILKYDDYYIYGSYNKRTEMYQLLKLMP